MLLAIKNITNVGRFVKFTSKPEVEFKRVNLIYAENGRGKTTIANILRSLATGETKHILERITVGKTESPEIIVQLDNKDCKFTSDTWDTLYPDIEVFDTTFVNENIHSGYTVDVEHKRGLYRFIIGKDGVILSSKIDDIDNDIRAINIEIKDIEGDLDSAVGGKIPFIDFVNLKEITDIFTLIQDKKKELEIVKDKNKVLNQALLEILSLPSFPESSLRDILSMTIETVLASAAESVQKHINQCMDNKGENWIKQGMDYIKDDNCPFCGQSLVSNVLFTAYSGYFSEAYEALKQKIIEYRTTIEKSFSKTSIRVFVATITNNKTLSEFWSDYISDPNPQIDEADLQIIWDRLCDELASVLLTKQQTILEAVNIPDGLSDVIRDYTANLTLVKNYNDEIEKYNNTIKEQKAFTNSNDLGKLQQELERLEFTQKRYENYYVNLCQKYNDTKQKKSSLEAQKQKAKQDLENYASKTIQENENALNKYLENFLTSFRIKQRKTKYTGGKPSSDYVIVINNQELSIGDTNVENKPSFKTLLSEGDKNALAFAFFMARLELMDSVELGNKIIVIDDPVSSLDKHRRQRTLNAVKELAKKVKQIIILSHDSRFLRDYWNDSKSFNHTEMPLSLYLSGVRLHESELEIWDVEMDTQSEYFKNFNRLYEYNENGSIGGELALRDIARCIRPCIEGYYKIRFPKQIKSTQSLGKTLIDNIDKAKQGEPLYHIKKHLHTLREINNFSKKYHHDENPGYESEPISDIELKDIVSKVIRLIHEG